MEEEVLNVGLEKAKTWISRKEELTTVRCLGEN